MGYVINSSGQFARYNNMMVKCTLGAPASSLLTGLTGYWKLDDAVGTGTIAASVGPTLTTNNITQSATGGKIGGRCTFSTGYTTGVDTTYEYASNFSVSCWFKTTSQTDQTIIGNYHPSGFGWFVFIDEYGRACMQVWDGVSTPAYMQAYTSTVYDNGAWHHIVCTFDGTYMKIYMDGELATTADAWAHDVLYNAGNIFQIGAQWDTIWPFVGEIDEVGIWNKLLTLTEIQELYNSDAGKTYPF